tara:strand:+ start:346 stop:1233 length:888 start_codon:yes stop_codon:yes gene_type:complete
MKNLFNYSIILLLILSISGCVKINNLYDKYELLEVKVLGLESEISQLTSALNSTTQALETATANYNNLQSSSDIQVSQLLSLIANLQDEKDSLEDELNIVKSSLVQLQIDVTGLTGDNNSLLETITSLTAQIEALEQATGTSTDTTSNTVSDIDFPDYKSQGHTLKAIGVWRLYSINSVPVSEENRFNLKIYPDEFNPNLLNNNDSGQTGWVEFNTSKKIGWYNSISSTNETQVYRIDSREIEGYSFQNQFIVYIAATDTKAETINFDGKVNYDTEIDYEIFPLGLDKCIFYRLK